MDNLTLVERFTAVSVIESRSQRVFTLSNGRTEQIPVRMASGQKHICRVSDKRI